MSGRPSALFHQCIIYDSDEPTARLIGIEYIVSEEVRCCDTIQDEHGN